MTKKLTPFFAVLFTATLLTGCSVLSPSDAGNSSQESPAAPEHGPDNAALDEALSEWEPLSEFAPQPFDKSTGDFSAADMKFMSKEISNFAKVATAEERVLLTEDLDATADSVSRVLPYRIVGMMNEHLTPTEAGTYPTQGMAWATRLPTGSTLLDTSAYTYAWHAKEKEYEDGVPGVTLTLAWLVVYRYVDPEGIERALPVYRWSSLNSPDVEWSDRESSWNFSSNVVTTNDTCAWAKDGALTADFQPSQINLEEWPMLTTEVGEYQSFTQYTKENPTPTPEDIADEVAACA